MAENVSTSSWTALRNRAFRNIWIASLRNGAYSWQIFADPSRRSYFHVEILMPSWSQYLLQCERITKAEKEVIDRALSLLKKPPEVRMYVRLNKPFASTETGN
jgi:hypothetical protein